MIKTLLVPASGSETDFVVFDTALTAALPFRAHLDFFHACVDCSEALRNMPHGSFVRGKAVGDALAELQETSDARCEAAERHVRQFCERHRINFADAPNSSDEVSASWHREPSSGEDLFVEWARVHDLTVMGRLRRPNGLPPGLLQHVLLKCGRPILVPGPHSPRRALTETVMLCWKDCRESARALTAAMPLLNQAIRVVVTTVDEGSSLSNACGAVAQQLAWHGIRAEPQAIKADGRPIATLLLSAAQNCAADLLIMGSYSTGPLRQTIFGGCTQSILEAADVPVFLLH